MPGKRVFSKSNTAKDRNAEFLTNLQRYSDWTSYDVKAFPENLPFRFTLNAAGKIPVGEVSIKWMEVRVALLIYSLEAVRPTSESRSEMLDRVGNLFSKASPEAKKAFLAPIDAMHSHVFEHLPRQLSDAFTHLFAEGHHHGMSWIVSLRGRRLKPSRSGFADSITKRIRRSILTRLPKPKRVNTRTKPSWKDTGNLMQYAAKVDSRKLLSEIAKKTFDRADGADDWRDDLVENNDYQLLKTSVPLSVLEWVLRRVAEDVPKRDREPLALACEMARQELGFEAQKPQTLRTYYTRGAALLKKKR